MTDMAIIDHGRNEDEVSVVLVENNVLPDSMDVERRKHFRSRTD